MGSKAIVVIADEAHRSQYDLIDGFARHMRDALPAANFARACSRAVFRDYISIYDIARAVEDGATVAIYYEGRDDFETSCSLRIGIGRQWLSRSIARHLPSSRSRRSSTGNSGNPGLGKSRTPSARWNRRKLYPNTGQGRGPTANLVRGGEHEPVLGGVVTLIFYGLVALLIHGLR